MTITVLSIHDAKAKSALADELERQILHLNARGGCSDDELSLCAREPEGWREVNRNGAVDGRTRSADGVERVLDKVVRGCGRHPWCLWRAWSGEPRIFSSSSFRVLRQTVAQFALYASNSPNGIVAEPRNVVGYFFRDFYLYHTSCVFCPFKVCTYDHVIPRVMKTHHTK